MMIILLAALYGAAQEDYVVYEGAESTHYVENHSGSIYSWNVLIDFSPDTEANSNDFTFTSSNGTNQVSVRWNSIGLFYLNVTETDITGCTNRKALVVNVLSSNRSIAFSTNASSDCYNSSGNGYELPLQILDDGGVPIDAVQFPVDVGFTLDGTAYSQQINYDQQALEIDASWLTLNSEQESQVTIQITNAKEKYGTNIPLLDGNDIHTITIYPIPELEFISIDSTVKEQNYGVYVAKISESNSETANYIWYIDPPQGSSTDLSDLTNSVAQILWDGPVGKYIVGVSVVDANGCQSDTIWQTVTVNETGSSPVAVNAGADTIIGNCQPYEFSAVSPISQDYTYSWQPTNYLSNPTIPNPVFTAGETTTYVLTLTTSSGYNYRDTVTITVSDIAADAGEDVLMSAGNTIILDGSASVGEDLNLAWFTNDGKIDEGSFTANPVISLPGTYYLSVNDAFGCSATDSVVVSLFANAPVASNDYDTTAYQTAIVIDVLANDDDVDNNLDLNLLTIIDYPANGTVDIDAIDYTITYAPNQNFTGTDIFEYQICDSTQLCDNATVYVLVTPLNFLIPQAFTPNGDNINDFFQILGIEYYPNNSITIINRWGKKVYEAQAYGIETHPTFWDGKSNVGGGNGDLPTGTYYYILDLGNGEKPIAGSVYIDR